MNDCEHSRLASRAGGPWLGILAGTLAWIAALLVFAALASCRTYEAVIGAPEGFWGTLAGMLKAILADIADLLV